MFKKISDKSAWNAQQIGAFLDDAQIPLRLSCIDADGFPAICSLWFMHVEGALLLATHQSAYVVRLLEQNPRVAFEVAVNDYPYRGVRGKATALLEREGAAEVLPRLIEKYLGDSNKQLASWLLGRVDEEYVIRLEPTLITAWDYGARMTP